MQMKPATPASVSSSVEYTVDNGPHMETIQVVLDAKLLQAADRAARRLKLNRSALVRNALREHLRKLEIRELEERDRKGYQSSARNADELSIWESEAVWPED
jgi:metal-responsive CopG/Arc/MetJ family transcriptional regulator